MFPNICEVEFESDRVMLNFLFIFWLEIFGYQPDVSVIVPIFNQELLLVRCLESVLNQSLKNIEIVCVDDGSTDNTLQILNEYSKKDERVKVVHQQNCGVSCAQNTGLAHVKGRYITFVHSDDWIELDELEVAFSKAEEKSADVVVWGFLLNGRYYGPKKEKFFQGMEAARFLMKDRSWHTVWTKMYISSMLKNNNVSFDISVKKIGEDVLFNLELIPYVDSLISLNRGFYHYSRTSTGLYETHTITDMQILANGILERMNKMKVNLSCKNCLQEEDIQFLTKYAAGKLKQKKKKK